MSNYISQILLSRISQLEHKIRLLSCCIGSGGGGTIIGDGSTFYHDVVADTDNTYQDNRLIGAQDVWFVLDSVPVHRSSFLFDSATGTITLISTTFNGGNPIIVTYIPEAEEPVDELYVLSGYVLDGYVL